MFNLYELDLLIKILKLYIIDLDKHGFHSIHYSEETRMLNRLKEEKEKWENLNV